MYGFRDCVMKVQIREIQSRSILTPQKAGSLSGHYDYSLNPYAGCAFACSYCYVPSFPNADHQPGDWGGWINAKVNAPELVARDRLKVFGSRIFFSSATDPYQYAELKYRLSRRCLEQLLKYQPAKLTMHTRSHLILQDIDLLKAFGDKLEIGVSITTDRDSIRKEFEPNAPGLKRRIELLKTLKENNINVFASLAPLLPCDPDRLISLLKPLVSRAWTDSMRYLDTNNKPELLKKYESFFQEENQRKVMHKIMSAFQSKRERQFTQKCSKPAGRKADRKNPVQLTLAI